MTAVPISIRLVRAPTAASSGNGDPSCLAKWCTRKYAPSAPSSSAATARSIDCSNASDADRVCEPGDDDQCPNDRKPIFFTSASTPNARLAFLPAKPENEPLPVPGLREVVVDSASRPVAVIETTAVRVMRLADVDLNHALGEGEGFSSVAEWRAGHEQFWHSAEMRQALGDPAFKVGDDTLVVASEFRLIQE